MIIIIIIMFQFNVAVSLAQGHAYQGRTFTGTWEQFWTDVFQLPAVGVELGLSACKSIALTTDYGCSFNFCTNCG